MLLRNIGLFLAFLTSSAFAGSQRLLGAEKCTWGPSYWCQGLKESAECSATKHCIRKYWDSNPQKYQGDDDDVCTICKNMVKEARDTLQSNQTQEELREVFEGSCALIPIKIVADECKKLVDEFIPELIETLSSEMNPDTVCSVAGLCNSKRIDKLLEKHLRKNPSKKSDCRMCKEESLKLSTQIANADKDLVLDKILEICGHAGSYSDACKALVMQDFDDIYNVLTHLEYGLCDVSGMCPSNQVTFIQPQADIQCEFCEKVIQHWIDTWTANTTEAEFKQVLEALCHKMKPERVQHCLHIVDDYYIPWFNYILHELNPKTVCTLMGLCNGVNGQFLQPNPEVSISLLLTADNVQDEPSNRMIGGYFEPQVVMEAEADKPTCVMCEYVLHKMQHWISENKTEEELEAALEKVCGYMPKSVRGQCDNIVETYGKAIIEMMSSEVDPKEICSMMHLCDENSVLNHVELKAIEETDKPTCVMCEYVIVKLRHWVSENKTEEEIEEALEKVCGYMPKSVRDQCDNVVETYGKAIVEMIASDVDPKEVCSLIQLCDNAVEDNPISNDVPVIDEIAEEKKADDYCAVCTMAMETLYQILENKDNEDEVKNALESLCRFMPSSIEDKCEEYIEAYTDMIIQLVLKDFTPQQICAELALCPSIEVAPEIVLTKQDTNCLFCEFVMRNIDDLMANATTDAQIIDALDQVCNALPTHLQGKCIKFVDKYGNTVIDFLTHKFTPEQICQQLALCLEHESNAEQFDMLYHVDEIIDDIDDVNDDRPYCTLCEYAIGEVDKLITDKQNEEEIKNVLDRICYELSAPIKKECLTMVSQYTDEIIEMFVNQYTPQEVCAELQLCNSPKKALVQVQSNDIPQIENEVSNKPLCILCEYFMSIVEKQIVTNRTLDMVEHAVEMACSYMPETVADKCIDFVQEYGDEVIDLIIKAEANPELVCSLMTLCEVQKTWDATAFGGHECTWGPAFWCQSKVHAHACGTTQHCEEHVWNN